MKGYLYDMGAIESPDYRGDPTDENWRVIIEYCCVKIGKKRFHVKYITNSRDEEGERVFVGGCDGSCLPIEERLPGAVEKRLISLGKNKKKS